MSVYATIINNDNDNPWFISVNVVHDEEPIRVNHGIAEWYLTPDQAKELVRQLWIYGHISEEDCE
jgi:hypothetical protein